MESVLVGLAVLACPVGMGVMMWFMSKGMRGRNASGPAPASTSVEDLRAEQQRLAAEIDRLEGKDESADRLAGTRS